MTHDKEINTFRLIDYLVFQTEVFQSTFNTTQEAFLRLKLIQSWEETGIRSVIEKQLPKLQRRFRTILCSIGSVLEFGVISGESSLQTKHVRWCQKAIGISFVGDSDKIHYVRNFAVENIGILEGHIASINHLLESDIIP